MISVKDNFQFLLFSIKTYSVGDWKNLPENLQHMFFMEKYRKIPRL